MKRLMLAVTLVATSFLSTPARASQVHADARIYSPNQCAYYSTIEGEFIVSYENRELPWGTSVEVIYGFNDINKISDDWERRNHASMNASAPYVWQAHIIDTVNSRGSFQSSEFRFVIKVMKPDGTIFYDKGTFSQLGYYAADFSNIPVACDRDSTQFTALPINPIDRR